MNGNNKGFAFMANGLYALIMQDNTFTQKIVKSSDDFIGIYCYI